MRSSSLVPLGSALAVALVVGACGKKEEPAPSVQEVPVAVSPKQAEPAAAPATEPAAPTPTVAARVLPENPATQIPEAEIPTEEDYEAEAETLISGDNLDDALDELEREVEK